MYVHDQNRKDLEIPDQRSGVDFLWQYSHGGLTNDDFFVGVPDEVFIQFDRILKDNSFTWAGASHIRLHVWICSPATSRSSMAPTLTSVARSPLA